MPSCNLLYQLANRIEEYREEKYEKNEEKKNRKIFRMTFQVMMVNYLVHKHLRSLPSPRVWLVGNNLVIAIKGCPFKSLASDIIKGEFLPK
jgi:hypothetical protein